MVRFLVLSFLFSVSFTHSQKLSGNDLLENAIAFHDPENNWPTFQGNFQVTMKTPNANDRVSDVQINLPEQKFVLDVAKNGVSYKYVVGKDKCAIELNGSQDFTAAEAKEHRLSCERANMYKNYYTYLYGLPMKLKDAGTIIDPDILQKKFKGKEYLVLRATYERSVGDDIWYFYFDPTTYAMEIYQFYHDEAKNDGEYILLSGMEEINGIKMPKNREWYYNKDDTYLGTDILETTDQ